MSYIKGHTGHWEYVIGLEVHAQISSNSKLFSSSATKFGSMPNSQVSLVDAAMPGMLPVLNKYCVYQAIKTGLGLEARINNISIFDRKNYFYPDLPQGYQISQFYRPIVNDGKIIIRLEDGTSKTIRINRLHLEQDAGKSIHDQSPTSSLIDLNRSGIALMEIVTEPDISSPQEAASYVTKLRAILRTIGSCDGDMEKGSLRCDANVSVRKQGDELGTRCEIKNINSIKNIVKAIEYEAKRQVELLEKGEVINQETRLYDADTNMTRTMRLKEDAHDYRYFPDPDLLPVIIADDVIAQIKKELPELPDAKIARYIKEIGLNRYDAEVIVEDESTAKYFEQAILVGNNAKLVANWMISYLFSLLNKGAINIKDCQITPDMLGRTINLIEQGLISGKIAKDILEIMFETGGQPEQIIEEKGLRQISNNQELESIIDQVISENQSSVFDFNNGRDKLFGFFVGQVMKKSNGKANPILVNDLLKKKLTN
ncbi:MAG: Asp-tRNA(Asn)/Glu-tRNA(Gln) amidotransferase subunit GatB [Rickettsiaceae bacterium]|nr:MAG: Asp-tRNA(Asn)/Glu-tRNA(Gln) amidotransferase subunit GatB [Rickettsiaceae bacterium]